MPEKPGLNAVLGLRWTKDWIQTSWSPIPPGKTYTQCGLCAARGWKCALPIISNMVPYFCFKPCQPRPEIIRGRHSSVENAINLLQVENVQ